MKIILVAAASENNVIGRTGDIPWKLPADQQYFRKVTMGKPIIMGRKTYESMGRTLPGRTNIIVTRRKDLEVADAVVVESLEDALTVATKEKPEEVCVIGGGEIYRQALPHATHIYLTRVHAEVEGDAFFPEIAADEWELSHKEEHRKDAANEHDFTILTYQRKPL